MHRGSPKVRVLSWVWLEYEKWFSVNSYWTVDLLLIVLGTSSSLEPLQFMGHIICYFINPRLKLNKSGTFDCLAQCLEEPTFASDCGKRRKRFFSEKKNSTAAGKRIAKQSDKFCLAKFNWKCTQLWCPKYESTFGRI